MWIFLGSECLFFGSLIATYLVYKGRSLVGPYPHEILNIPFTSFSTFDLLMSSLAMVLALAAVQRGDMKQGKLWLLVTALLGLVFTAGMMATDALNGLWVSHLLRSADRRAAAASRLMSLAIGLTSLAIAALAAARFALPALDQRVASWGVALSAAVVVAVAVSYGVAMRLAAREA